MRAWRPESQRKAKGSVLLPHTVMFKQSLCCFNMSCPSFLSSSGQPFNSYLFDLRPPYHLDFFPLPIPGPFSKRNARNVGGSVVLFVPTNSLGFPDLGTAFFFPGPPLGCRLSWTVPYTLIPVKMKKRLRIDDR